MSDLDSPLPWWQKGGRGGATGTHSAIVLVCSAVETQHQGTGFERHLVESNDEGEWDVN